MTTPHVLLALLAFAPLPLLAQVRPPVAQPLSVGAEAVCRGAPFPNAPPYDTSRPGIHMLAEPGYPTDNWPNWHSGAYARWYAQQHSDLELVLCFASGVAAVDTCRGYRIAGTSTPASDVVFAKQRWSIRLLEARTGRVVDTLQLQYDGSSDCPGIVSVSPLSAGYIIRRVDLPERSADVWDWASRFVEPRSPGALLRRACDGWDMEGCFNLGAMYAEGRGVAESDTRAEEFLQRACDGGIMRGCASVGFMLYPNVRSVAQRDSLNADFYRRECNGGDMRGCMILGAKYEAGRGVARDLARAAEFYRRACDGGVSVACEFLRRASPEVRP